jgi:hypothetical protein
VGFILGFSIVFVFFLKILLTYAPKTEATFAPCYTISETKKPAAMPQAFF